jgi:Bacterial membrane protein YfhO
MAAYEPGLIRQKIAMRTVPEVGESRAMLRREAEQNLDIINFRDPLSTVLYARLALFDEDNLLDGIPKLTGMYSLYVPQTMAVLQALLKPGSPASGLADFLGVSQINVPGRATEWTTRPTYLPWVTGGQRPVFATKDQTLHGLAAPGFDPRTTVFLPETLRGSLGVTNASKPRIKVLEFSAQRVRVQAESPAPALIVIAQSYYHNWKASIDARPAPLLRANYGFQAVQIAPGRHQVVLVYRDRMLELGAILSVASAAILALLWFRGSEKTRLPGSDRDGLLL